jgi:hypothetical protein
MSRYKNYWVMISSIVRQMMNTNSNPKLLPKSKLKQGEDCMSVFKEMSDKVCKDSERMEKLMKRQPRILRTQFGSVKKTLLES